MGIGGGIALIVIGAILAFALNLGISGIDLRMIGYICMAAGLVVIVLSLVMQSTSRRSTRTVVQENYGAPGVPQAGGTTVVREERTDPPPPAI